MMIAGASGVMRLRTWRRMWWPAWHHALAGRWAEAAALHRKYFSLFEAMSLKRTPFRLAAMAMRGLIEETYRMPLCEMTPETGKVGQNPARDAQAMIKLAVSAARPMVRLSSASPGFRHPAGGGR